MALVYTKIVDLHPSVTNSMIKVICIRRYAIKYGGEQSSIECVEHDREGTRIHLTIPRGQCGALGHIMQEDVVVQIRNFFVRNNNFVRNKTVDNPYRIVLFPKSQMSACVDPDFPLQKFLFKDFNDISAIEDANEEVLFDVIGVLVGKRYIKDQNNVKLIELVLEDARPTLYKVSVGIKFSKKTLSLNLETVKEDSVSDEDINVKAIDEIVTNENGEAWICGTIESVDCSYTWCYMACIRCTRKVAKLNNRFFCGACNKYDGKANQRYMLILNVVDSTNNVSLLVWDKESITLLGKKASEIELKGNEIGHLEIIPKEIESAHIGKTILFKVQLRADIKTLNDRPYIVLKVCNNADTVQKYASTNGQNSEGEFNVQSSQKSFEEECEGLSQITTIPVLSGNKKVI
ncbi:uncharacterized protein LOC131025837 [Salvia miltiorrhiza]|uniref:uncharacterized protein LOC131025837 n=1 Tax=Salvia miltiorrhiza TaxID=226208 RepID=UPI0025AD5D51|nr:uncharacterized protein LOC131025837 [Salvia miltiorrhiza]